jgi:superfamily I DNA and/or RNA helicase
VAGDNKQLPPTRFFQVDLDSDEDEDEMDDVPLESILDECSAVPNFNQSMLKWHYRSKHEELISFSNSLFYNGALVTFPSPYVGVSSGAVQFHHVSDGVYDRGASKTNRKEAAEIIKLVSRHLRQNQWASVGVITLSIAQEEAVLQEWEKRMAAEPDLAALVSSQKDEPFFIKALEKVQGDERDYIFISIGYGPDQNGVVHMNFGPINRQGGQRRLNVAITRSRYQTTIVSSMHPHQLDLAKLTTGHEGVKTLQKYMEYAKNGGRLIEQVSGTDIPESDFEYAVKDALESKGYTVDAQVGFSGFRIDLGVHHPDHPNRYILGIECDGATYHSHKTARDRDRSPHLVNRLDQKSVFISRGGN